MDPAIIGVEWVGVDRFRMTFILIAALLVEFPFCLLKSAKTFLSPSKILQTVSLQLSVTGIEKISQIIIRLQDEKLKKKPTNPSGNLGASSQPCKKANEAPEDFSQKATDQGGHRVGSHGRVRGVQKTCGKLVKKYNVKFVSRLESRLSRATRKNGRNFMRWICEAICECLRQSYEEERTRERLIYGGQPYSTSSPFYSSSKHLERELRAAESSNQKTACKKGNDMSDFCKDEPPGIKLRRQIDPSFRCDNFEGSKNKNCPVVIGVPKVETGTECSNKIADDCSDEGPVRALKENHQHNCSAHGRSDEAERCDGKQSFKRTLSQKHFSDIASSVINFIPFSFSRLANITQNRHGATSRAKAYSHYKPVPLTGADRCYRAGGKHCNTACQCSEGYLLSSRKKRNKRDCYDQCHFPQIEISLNGRSSSESTSSPESPCELFSRKSHIYQKFQAIPRLLGYRKNSLRTRAITTSCTAPTSDEASGAEVGQPEISLGKIRNRGKKQLAQQAFGIPNNRTLGKTDANEDHCEALGIDFDKVRYSEEAHKSLRNKSTAEIDQAVVSKPGTGKLIQTLWSEAGVGLSWNEKMDFTQNPDKADGDNGNQTIAEERRHTKNFKIDWVSKTCQNTYRKLSGLKGRKVSPKSETSHFEQQKSDQVKDIMSSDGKYCNKIANCTRSCGTGDMGSSANMKEPEISHKDSYLPKRSVSRSRASLKGALVNPVHRSESRGVINRSRCSNQSQSVAPASGSFFIKTILLRILFVLSKHCLDIAEMEYSYDPKENRFSFAALVSPTLIHHCLTEAMLPSGQTIPIKTIRFPCVHRQLMSLPEQLGSVPHPPRKAMQDGNGENSSDALKISEDKLSRPILSSNDTSIPRGTISTLKSLSGTNSQSFATNIQNFQKKEQLKKYRSRLCPHLPDTTTTVLKYIKNQFRSSLCDTSDCLDFFCLRSCAGPMHQREKKKFQMTYFGTLHSPAVRSCIYFPRPLPIGHRGNKVEVEDLLLSLSRSSIVGLEFRSLHGSLRGFDRERRSRKAYGFAEGTKNSEDYEKANTSALLSCLGIRYNEAYDSQRSSTPSLEAVLCGRASHTSDDVRLLVCNSTETLSGIVSYLHARLRGPDENRGIIFSTTANYLLPGHHVLSPYYIQNVTKSSAESKAICHDNSPNIQQGEQLFDSLKSSSGTGSAECGDSSLTKKPLPGPQLGLEGAGRHHAPYLLERTSFEHVSGPTSCAKTASKRVVPVNNPTEEISTAPICHNVRKIEDFEIRRNAVRDLGSKLSVTTGAGGEILESAPLKSPHTVFESISREIAGLFCTAQGVQKCNTVEEQEMSPVCEREPKTGVGNSESEAKSQLRASLNAQPVTNFSIREKRSPLAAVSDDYLKGKCSLNDKFLINFFRASSQPDSFVDEGRVYLSKLDLAGKDMENDYFQLMPPHSMHIPFVQFRTFEKPLLPHK